MPNAKYVCKRKRGGSSEVNEIIRSLTLLFLARSQAPSSKCYPIYMYINIKIHGVENALFTFIMQDC